MAKIVFLSYNMYTMSTGIVTYPNMPTLPNHTHPHNFYENKYISGHNIWCRAGVHRQAITISVRSSPEGHLAEWLYSSVEIEEEIASRSLTQRHKAGSQVVVCDQLLMVTQVCEPEVQGTVAEMYTESDDMYTSNDDTYTASDDMFTISAIQVCKNNV